MFILDSYQFKVAFKNNRGKGEENIEEESFNESLMGKDKPAIECNDVSKKMKEHKDPIISNISFEVQRGSIMGLLGPSGAGKSTLFNLLSMINARDSGQIVLGSVNLDKASY
jgi:ABC-type bacteriocin/lantibiotic exporter with double-glycine peptidase domain